MISTHAAPTLACPPGGTIDADALDIQFRADLIEGESFCAVLLVVVLGDAGKAQPFDPVLWCALDVHLLLHSGTYLGVMSAAESPAWISRNIDRNIS